MLDGCTLRYRAYFETGMIGRAILRSPGPCGDASVLGFFCAKLLSFSELQFGLGRLPSASAPRLIAWGFAEVPISSASADPCTPKQRPHSLEKTW